MHKAQSYQFIQVSNSEQLLLSHDVPAVTATLITMLSLHCCYTEHDISHREFNRVLIEIHASANLIFEMATPKLSTYSLLPGWIKVPS